MTFDRRHPPKSRHASKLLTKSLLLGNCRARVADLTAISTGRQLQASARKVLLIAKV
ncbi:hypothetical protein MFFC18_49950 [Mariniblastus fucicola]|uniref:Uncharacterized protein n=1 Tax=Mariniblastus fucicola TaxID=980251 RepID=A0A5B9PK19_9BACT|nr:hypothetical protein MFFC18_49950 [Mariniblastus fucicola]